MTRQRTRNHTLIALALAASSVLSACASQEPSSLAQAKHKEPVTITIDEGSTGQAVIARIYQRVLEQEERRVEKIHEAETGRVDYLLTGGTDFIVGCTGEMLDTLDPNRASELREELAEAQNPAEASQIADHLYAEMVGSLPYFAATTDRSVAQPCTVEDLPQNLVPIFRTDAFDRDEVAAINGITKLLTDEDIADIQEEIEAGEDVETAVDEWLRTNGIVAEFSPDS